jgi:hypothetical protein
MIKLRITTDGRISGLWTDTVQMQDIGLVHVRRASHVEFDDCRQCWFVREAQPKKRLTNLWYRLLGQPVGRILHQSRTRKEALTWEHEHFAPGGPGWSALSNPPA